MDKVTFILVAKVLYWPYAALTVATIMFLLVAVFGNVKLTPAGDKKTMGKTAMLLWTTLFGLCTGTTAIILKLVPKFCQ